MTARSKDFHKKIWSSQESPWVRGHSTVLASDLVESVGLGPTLLQGQEKFIWPLTLLCPVGTGTKNNFVGAGKFQISQFPLDRTIDLLLVRTP